MSQLDRKYGGSGERRRDRAFETALHSQKAVSSEFIAYAFPLLILVLPVVIFIFLRRRQKTQRRQVASARTRIENGVTDHRQIALDWIEAQANPAEHIPSLPKLQENFRKILELNTVG